jgi:CheY-like chemotaxis protein
MTKILIVEDEDALRNIYVMLFNAQPGYTVYEAMNGQIALEQVKLHQPDVIILDILMPVMTGIEFLENANLKTDHTQTKVLVLSNLSDTKSLNKIRDLGADKYILKSSTSPTKLIESVKELL